MSEDLDEMIEVLKKNQDLLDSKNKIILRKYVGDLNFAFLEILKRIKKKNKESEKITEGRKKIYSGMFM